MSAGDIKIVSQSGKISNPVRRFRVPAGQAAIAAGEPVKILQDTAVGSYYPLKLIDADGTILENMYFLGITAAAGTHSSSAAGYVDVYLDTPGTVYRAKVKTANAANTVAKVDAFTLYRLVIDLTSSKYRIDDTTATAGGQAFIVVGGNPDEDALDFCVAEQGTWRNWGNSLN